MIFTAANIILLAGVFTGIGLLWPWSVFKQERRFESLLLCFWIGWGLVIGVLQVWHLAFPVGLPAFVLILAAGGLGWVLNRQAIGVLIRAWGRRKMLWLGGLCLVPALILANQVLFTPPNSDYALYHLQQVKWIATYRIIPGLGNLYNPLALNCSSFLYTAAIDSGWLAGRAYYVSTTLLVVVLLWQCGNGFYNLLTRGSVRSSDLFYALMIPVVLLNAATGSLVAYSPDMIVFILHIVMAGEVLRLFEDEPGLERFKARATTMVLLAAVAFTVKLSLGVFGLLCLLPVIVLGVRRYGLWPWRSPRLWGGWLGLGLLLVLTWMARSVVISGYPLFPSPALAFPVPWKMPLDIVLDAEMVIKTWARTNNAAFPYTGDWFWFQQWWNVFPYFVRQAFLITLGLLVLNQILFLIFRKQTRRDAGASGLALICIPSIIFWFTMAPSYRHSGALLWIFLIAEMLVTFRLVTGAGWAARPELIGAALVVLMALWQSPNQFSNNLSRSLFFMPKTEQALAAENIPAGAYRQQMTDSGLAVNIPPEGIEECWNAPLPCTTKANFVNTLRLLKPGDLQSGFARGKP